MKVTYLRQPARFIKKSSKVLKSAIRNEIEVINDNPKVGKQLKGKLKSLRTHRFIFNKVHYRIAYKFNNDLLIIYIASRENFYKDLQL